ncbi:1,4-alpha-glucan-branching enzyme [Pseudohyphozyma bogoriensis]|nr:1,4-alpha-glucan-branching enzyme [Pseudohyphozyma bogoriensis]
MIGWGLSEFSGGGIGKNNFIHSKSFSSHSIHSGGPPPPPSITLLSPHRLLSLAATPLSRSADLDVATSSSSPSSWGPTLNPTGYPLFAIHKEGRSEHGRDETTSSSFASRRTVTRRTGEDGEEVVFYQDNAYGHWLESPRSTAPTDAQLDYHPSSGLDTASLNEATRSESIKSEVDGMLYPPSAQIEKRSAGKRKA